MIRSSPLASQRSPNLAQPIPRMTTLSLIPLAMMFSLPFLRVRSGRLGCGCRLPEVTPEVARIVEVLDAEHHAHVDAGLHVAWPHVGHVDHQAATAGELHHPEVVRRA